MTDSKQYLWTLRTNLTGKMKRDELERTMTYYYDYFKEAGPEGEAALMEELGAPEQLAAQLLGMEIPEPDQSEAWNGNPYERPLRRGMPLWLKILLGFFLFPVILGVVISIYAVVLSLGAAAVGCLAGAAGLVWAGLSVILQSGATTVVFVGGGIMIFGVGLLLVVATAALGKVSCQGTARFFRWLFNGRGA